MHLSKKYLSARVCLLVVIGIGCLYFSSAVLAASSLSTLVNGLEVTPRILIVYPQKSDGTQTEAMLQEQRKISMPYVTGGSAEVTSRINDALYIGQMQIPAPEKPGSFFSLPEGMELDGTTEMNFEITRNDTNILEIVFAIEDCGEYCERYTNTIDFDVHTGRTISLDDLLTSTGKKLAANRMQKERRKMYLTQIQNLDQRRKLLLATTRKNINNDEIWDLYARIALNEECLSSSSADTDYMQFMLPAKGIVLTSKRCSLHANQALDDVGEVRLTLTQADLQSVSTSYGKALLQEQHATRPLTLTSRCGQVLNGVIGDAAITIMFNQCYREDSYGAVYYYKEYRTLIGLEGKTDGKELVLTEAPRDQKTAIFTLQFGGDSVSGTWMDKGKKLPVVFKY